MHLIEFNVKKQIISYKPCRLLISDSVGHVHARFTLDDEWTGLALTAVFTNSATKKSVSVVLRSDLVEVPPEVLVSGHLSVSLIGLCEEGKKRIPTAELETPIKIHQAGQLIGEALQQYTPELWEQLLGIIGPLAELKTSAKESLVAAINEVFLLPGGGNAIGDLSKLSTEAKENIVAAINEVAAELGDLSMALDEIIAIQEGYIAKAPIPVGEEAAE